MDNTEEFNRRYPICGSAVVVGPLSYAPTGGPSGACEDNLTFTITSDLGYALVHKLYLPLCPCLVAVLSSFVSPNRFSERSLQALSRQLRPVVFPPVPSHPH